MCIRDRVEILEDDLSSQGRPPGAASLHEDGNRVAHPMRLFHRPIQAKSPLAPLAHPGGDRRGRSAVHEASAPPGVTSPGDGAPYPSWRRSGWLSPGLFDSLRGPIRPRKDSHATTIQGLDQSSSSGADLCRHHRRARGHHDGGGGLHLAGGAGCDAVLQSGRRRRLVDLGRGAGKLPPWDRHGPEPVPPAAPGLDPAGHHAGALPADAAAPVAGGTAYVTAAGALSSSNTDAVAFPGTVWYGTPGVQNTGQLKTGYIFARLASVKVG